MCALVWVEDIPERGIAKRRKPRKGWPPGLRSGAVVMQRQSSPWFGECQAWRTSDAEYSRVLISWKASVTCVRSL
jgi:hypothetical protein